MTDRKYKLVSVALQEIAQSIDDMLAAAAGDRIMFVMICQVDGTSQYISNGDRADGTNLIKDLLARWEAGKADIPAHLNPDL